MSWPTLTAFAVALASVASPAAAREAPPVTVTQDEAFFTLSNGVISAKIEKAGGELRSLVYKDIETVHNVGRGGFWSHDAKAPDSKATITIDPSTNGGERAEVSVKGISGGLPMGRGPGGNAIADIEIRYCLERGSSGLYTYSIWEHQPAYPATNVGEARFCLKLSDDVFDWMTVDARRNMKMITTKDWNYGEVMNMKEVRRMTTGEFKGMIEHKYDYSAGQFDTPAWGWSSTTKKVGLWFINPSVEYLSSGPTKIELSAHRDATFNPDDKTAPAPPCLLNYWRSSHYGGSILAIAEGEHWTKVIGPFLIYCNSGETPDAMWKDALAHSDVQAKAWPFDWVNGVDYPKRAERGAVSGQLVLRDLPDATMSNLLVGLSAPAYTVQIPERGEVAVDWHNDAKHYEFWVRADADGRFVIPNVRPGPYTLHAIADGVLGEFSHADVNVAAGKPIDLGTLEWKPERLGRQLWEIGTPNRTASEFKHGDNYWHWGLYLQYPKDFPNDVDFTIGKSNPRTDWNYVQVPRAQDEFGKVDGTPTTWTVRFNLPEVVKGKAILRLSICGAGPIEVTATMNDQPIGSTGKLVYNGTINRDAIQGSLVEKRIAFDASLMKQGENELKLSIPGGGVMNGVEYDYLRLELAE